MLTKYYFNRHKRLDQYNLQIEPEADFFSHMAKIPPFFVSFLLVFPLILGAKPLELTPSDVCAKIEEILRAHASHHTLDKPLIARALHNLLEELDPNFCYLTEPEIAEWLEPSDESLTKTVCEVKQKRFATFEAIYERFLASIARRRAIEAQICQEPLPDDVSHEEFKDITWAKTEAELRRRLHRVRALQLKTAQRVLPPHEQEQFQKRLDRRRVRREEALLTRKGDHSLLTYTLKALAAALDSQTAYFTPAEANLLMMQVQKRLFGIGAQLADDVGGLTIVRILEDSPLSKLPEIQIDDRIIGVNHEPIIGMDISEAVELIRGPEGTTVTLTFLRGERQFDVQIVRGVVVLKESRFEARLEPFGRGMIALLKLHSFYQDETSASATDLEQALDEFKRKHALQGVILDLRGNMGGLLPQAVSVASLFMRKGVVVSIKDSSGFVQHLRNLSGTPVWEGPLIILTDRLSASASEIVAQTLQEYGRALVVGDPETFGKGTFQTFTLESARYGKVNTQGEYKVTRGCYYTVSGRTPQKVGLKAQIVVPSPFANLDIGERFAKYPLEPDTIAPSFEDDLSDIPLLHRPQIARLYKNDLQPVVQVYDAVLPKLSSNSAGRVIVDAEFDWQEQEAVNIMKDLLLLSGPKKCSGLAARMYR